MKTDIPRNCTNNAKETNINLVKENWVLIFRITPDSKKKKKNPYSVFIRHRTRVSHFKNHTN